jgi:hypothetical protein
MIDGLSIVRERYVMVEPVTHSGFVDMGGVDFYVLYEDEERRATMQVRLLDCHPSCKYVSPADIGKVYVVKPYREEEFLHRGKRYYEMSEHFLESEVEGYDQAADTLSETHEDEPYPVCGK